MKKQKPYKPSKKVLEKYADVLVNFALGSYKGIKKGDVVRVFVEVKLPLVCRYYCVSLSIHYESRLILC